MKDVVVANPDDSRVLSEYGKALTAAGRSNDAVPFLAPRLADRRQRLVDAVRPMVWHSTRSAAMGPARDNYEAALKLSPGNPIVSSNLAPLLSARGQNRPGRADLAPIGRAPRRDAANAPEPCDGRVDPRTGPKPSMLVRGDLVKSDADNNITVLNQLSASNAAVDVRRWSAPPSEAPNVAPASPDTAPVTPPKPAASAKPAPVDDDGHRSPTMFRGQSRAGEKPSRQRRR